MDSGKSLGPEALPGLEALRFFAALSIIVHHTARMPQLAVPPNWGIERGYLAMGVPLFFAVSAFGLYLGYQAKLGDRDSVRQYYRRRFFRIAPLFYVMLVVYVVYKALVFNQGPDVPGLVTSALFIFNLVPQHVQGVVWASWSIGVEMLFYAVLPLLVIFVTRTRHAIALFLTALVIAASWRTAFVGIAGPVGEFANFSLAAHLYYFAAGILGFRLYSAIRARVPAQRMVGRVLLGASAVAVVLLAAAPVPFRQVGVALVGVTYAEFFVKGTWALALAGMVAGISLAPVTVIANRVTCALGRASFSLYLLHPLIVGSLARSGVYAQIYLKIDSSQQAFGACVLLTLSLVVPLALLTYRFVERPGMALANRPRRAAMGAGVPPPAGLAVGLITVEVKES